MRLLLLMMGLCMVSGELFLGTGSHDMTGPIVDVKFMGMANPSQVGTGLWQRLRSRAFVAWNKETSKRFAFVSIDAGMGGWILKQRVVQKLQAKYGDLYDEDNVGISGTHTHSGPSGFLQNVIFQFAGSGWVPQTVDRFVNGVVQSIIKAHNNLVPAEASVVIGELHGASINRSPTAYLLNPEEERRQYKENTDKNMTLLKLKAKDGTELGMFNWFAVHPTSLNNTNTLVSGDNKGYASYLFEKLKNGPTSKTFHKSQVGDADSEDHKSDEFVAAFCSTNLGDVSPNTKGARCQDTGLPCDALHSTCNGFNEKCVSSGPGDDMYDSCRIIGKKQFAKARHLYNTVGKLLGSEVSYIHTYIEMPGYCIKDEAGQCKASLCKAALGDSFAAGTTDGPGMFDFTQGQTSNKFFEFIMSFLHQSTEEEKQCQHPKGILIPTGSVSFPWPWAPSVLPMQLFRLGSLFIALVPTEMTTMAGRRLRKTVSETVLANSEIQMDPIVVIAGLSNGYADYTATFEEYQQQRYEGGSTIYGPHQLEAYQQIYNDLTTQLITSQGTNETNKASRPKDFSEDLIDTGEKLKSDHLPTGADSFGQVLTEPQALYEVGSIVKVEFAGGNPNNDLMTESTFLQIQHCLDSKCFKYNTIATDHDANTMIHIRRNKNFESQESTTWEMQWTSNKIGFFRMQHNGTHLHENLFGEKTFTPYSGMSRVFKVAKGLLLNKEVIE